MRGGKMQNEVYYVSKSQCESHPSLSGATPSFIYSCLH